MDDGRSEETTTSEKMSPEDVVSLMENKLEEIQAAEEEQWRYWSKRLAGKPGYDALTDEVYEKLTRLRRQYAALEREWAAVL